MANLIGSKPNQVPTNGSLGTMAFQDKENVQIDNLEVGSIGSTSIGSTSIDAVELKAIAESKAETAVDVFVYDTRKDSDGGAWRKRTQGTSWYNEPLNTATRGSRKEFPAVAVIVAESNKVTIYDGDDPSLPMWMVFTGNNASSSLTWFGTDYSGEDATCLFMKNATLAIGVKGVVSDVSGLSSVNFLSELFVKNSGSVGGYINRPIANRNIPFSVIGDNTTNIVNKNINDVAMTVLPNAPIDPDTGLPIPTIAVATEGGVSVIKDDGNVWDITASWPRNYKVVFTEDNKLLYQVGNASSQGLYRLAEIPTADYVSSSGSQDDNIRLGGTQIYASTAVPYIADYSDADYLVQCKDSYDLKLSGGDRLINYARENVSTDSMVAYTTSTYNTGWMNGDIKLATLSDTDDTDLVGTGELVDIASFTDISYGSSTVTESGGVVTGNYVDSSCIYRGDTFTTTAGRTYTATLNHTSGTTCAFRVRDSNNEIDLAIQTAFTSAGIITLTFTATSNGAYVRFENNQSFTFQDLSVRLAEPDRSVNGNGLQVFGTVQKNPVATGADLVAYSGFSSSNYLEQPYNPDLDFGTGDFCIMGWIKSTGGAGAIISNGDYDSTDNYWFGEVTGGILRFSSKVNGSTSNVDTASGVLSSGVWQHVAVVRHGDNLYLYVDNYNAMTASFTRDLDLLGDVGLTIGALNNGGIPFKGSLALLRISATAPTAEQIAKIYRDEKPLFQEGAQATLYGTSDAVTALAFDQYTDLLHVGTSAGRSVFQGLQRVDNTTDAVGTAISASDNFIAEE